MKVKFFFLVGECFKELVVIWGVFVGEEFIWDKLFLLVILFVVVIFGILWEDENVFMDVVIILVLYVFVVWVNKVLIFIENKGFGVFLRMCDCVVLIFIFKGFWRREDLIFCFVNESDFFVNNLFLLIEMLLLL